MVTYQAIEAMLREQHERALHRDRLAYYGLLASMLFLAFVPRGGVALALVMGATFVYSTFYSYGNRFEKARALVLAELQCDVDEAELLALVHGNQVPVQLLRAMYQLETAELNLGVSMEEFFRKRSERLEQFKKHMLRQWAAKQ